MSKNEQYHGAHLNKKKIVWSTVCSRKWKRSIFSALSNTCKKTPSYHDNCCIRSGTVCILLLFG